MNYSQTQKLIEAVESIAASLEKLANPPIHMVYWDEAKFQEYMKAYLGKDDNVR